MAKLYISDWEPNDEFDERPGIEHENVAGYYDINHKVCVYATKIKKDFIN